MKVTVAMGDGIGPEIMKTVLNVFEAAGVELEYDVVEMGKQVAQSGNKTGISPEARRSVESTGVLLKGPMETPKGGGYKSVNVTARKMWGTFANKRVYRKLPGVATPTNLRALNLTMVRENIEDTYGAVEHMQTHDVAQCRRFITRPGSEQVHRYTFEMAARKRAHRVTCAHKANIMKLTDGLFLDTFYEVAKDYPEIRADDVIVDALAMRLVTSPGDFDVIVLPNLQGDILTDLAAGLVGGLAYAPSANIGDGVSIFEAVHGTAPDIVGQERANPTALLLSGTMMLRHLGLMGHAARIEAALEQTTLRASERKRDGGPVTFSTSAFEASLIEEIARWPQGAPESAQPISIHTRHDPVMRESARPNAIRLRGVDVFFESALTPMKVAAQLQSIDSELELTMLSNRGTQVWPTGSSFTDCINHYRARFEAPDNGDVTQSRLIAHLGAVAPLFPLCGAEWLREIDGAMAYSRAQGQG